MRVRFRKSGERRYAVIVERGDGTVSAMDPAPGFDASIPHDLVHYVVEAELGLAGGVYGRAAAGGGTFVGGESGSAKERARARRKKERREKSLASADEARASDMVTSERLAGLADLAFRKRAKQTPDPARWSEPTALSDDDARRVGRVVSALESLAPRWNALPVGEELVFDWPSREPRPPDGA